MVHAIVRRILSGLGVVLGVVTLTFFLLHLAPGDPASHLVGPAATDAQIAAQRHALGLDRPLLAQYAAWLGRFVQLDWGTSIATGRPVSALLKEAWPATVWLVGLSLLLSYLGGVVLGAVQARVGRRADAALAVTSVTLYALPGYWLGLMLVMLFTYKLRLLPAFGAAGLDADFLGSWGRFTDRLRHLALPLVTLTLIGVGGIARYVRGAMFDARAQPFVVSARARGLSENRVTYRHVLRNALIPVLTLFGLSLPALFSGAVFVEGIFAWPGVGRVLIEAVQARDYPVVMAATALSALLVVAGGVLAQWLTSLADPRVGAA